jgi:RNA polymerase sigma-70 factor (ECF subfamily)
MMPKSSQQLAVLYQDVGPSLLAYLRRRATDPHLAEDLLQETFWQAARRPDRLRRVQSPRAWLFAIARNLAATAVRRQRRTQPLPESVAAPAARPDPRVERAHQAIAGLPEGLREALELRLCDDLSYAEIAAILDIPVGTVRSRLHHGLRRVRAAVAAEQESA